MFTTGFSYGGAMSYKLACVRSDKFRAALVYEAGPVSGNNQAECTKPIAWFQSHGADDQTFNLQTGLSILNVFTKVNGCTAMTPPTAPTNGHTLRLVRRLLGRSPHPLVLLRLRREQPKQHQPARPLSVAEGSRAEHELGAGGGLELHHAVLAARGRPP